jgi:hypothetical protein
MLRAAAHKALAPLFLNEMYDMWRQWLWMYLLTEHQLCSTWDRVHECCALPAAPARLLRLRLAARAARGWQQQPGQVVGVAGWLWPGSGAGPHTAAQKGQTLVARRPSTAGTMRRCGRLSRATPSAPAAARRQD